MIKSSPARPGDDELRAAARRLGEIAEAAKLQGAPRRLLEIDASDQQLDALLAEQLPQMVRLAEIELEFLHFRDSCVEPMPSSPGWTILLSLFVGGQDGENLAMRSLAALARVGGTTTNRYVTLFEEQGLARRVPSRDDLRVTYVELTDAGRRAVVKYLVGRMRINQAVSFEQ